ncbi:MAG: sensor histidine kinase [Mucilaginibacter sp.]|nr:sensor histidine kinase [Mucilaginibacter sp.]
MKLFEIYNRISLFAIVVIILITGIVYYYTISSILTYQIDKDLVVEENEIFDYVHLNHQLPQVFRSEDQQIYFKSVGNEPVTREFINTTFWNTEEKENELGRGLLSSVTVENKKYLIRIIESKVETEYLIRIIFLITIGLIVLLILILFITNRLLIKKLWQPFYNTLYQLKQFNLTDKDDITPPKSEIEEFKELNDAVTAMTLRVKDDYNNLKHFTENASHELLTPIAVINSKLDILIQTGDFSPRQGELLSDVYETVSKLTRLNRAMLLLSKIENKLITDNAPINIKGSIEETLNQFNELFINKSITVTADLQDVTLIISKSLFEVLMNNLFSNAIRHNVYGGKIIISLNASGLMIKNTGADMPLDIKQIFQRFKKSVASEGNGLGLTLSQQICSNYNMRLTYIYSQPFHIFSILF